VKENEKSQIIFEYYCCVTTAVDAGNFIHFVLLQHIQFEANTQNDSSSTSQQYYLIERSEAFRIFESENLIFFFS
jgi:hypothetical protein